jgi:hypothetical protein
MVDNDALDAGFMSLTTSGLGATQENCVQSSDCDVRALVRQHGTNTDTGFIQASAAYFVPNLNPVATVFTAVYRSGDGSTVNFSNRSLTVIPMP